MAIPTISPPIPATPTSPTTSHQHLHFQHRSPKRTFDESSEEDGGSSGGGGSGSGREEKRSRVGSTGRSRLGFRDDLDADAGSGSSNMDRDGDRDTPGLSAPGSSSETTSSDSFSDLASPSPPPQVEPDMLSAPMMVSSSSPPPPPRSPKSKLKIQDNKGGGNSKPLTRRQRKALGLPKPRHNLTSSAGAGKIIIPGGKWKGRQSQDTAVVGVVDGDGGGDEEWRRNGTGRVDVRGFRELKI